MSSTYLVALTYFYYFILFLSAHEADLKLRIEALESTVEEYEKQRKKLLHDFDAYKDECANHEDALTSEHQQKISSVSKELQKCQNEFTKQVAAFEALMQAFEQEKSDAIDDLQKAHQVEIENLLRTQQSQSDAVSSELDILKAQHREESNNLQEAYNKLKQEKEDIHTDYDEKLAKLKAFYEKELESIQKSQTSSFAEQNSHLQQHIDKLTKDYQFQEVQYRQRIDGLVKELAEAESRISDLDLQNTSLSSQSSSAADTVNNLMTQVMVILVNELDKNL